MALIVYVNGIDKTSSLTKNTFRMSKALEGERSLNLSFNCKASVWMPSLGQDIKVYDGAVLLFGGIISKQNKTFQDTLKSADAYVQVDISSDGYNSIPARRTINSYRTSATAGDIFQNIVDVVLNDPSNYEGIAIGGITAGATFATYSMVCKSVKEIFDDLATQSGCQWYIDDNKSIYFISETTPATAAYTLDISGAFTAYTLDNCSEDLTNYTNKIFAKKNEDTYTYVSDTAEISARQTIEGSAYSSGVYGRVIEANDATASDLTTAANDELKKYSFSPMEFGITCYTSIFTAGEKIQVFEPRFNMTGNETYIIERIDTARVDNNILEYSLALTKRKSADFSTKANSRGRKFFADLVKKAAVSVSKGEYAGVTGVIKNYQANNTQTATFTTAKTEVLSKTFEVGHTSDIHMAYSAKVNITATATLTIDTYLANGTTTLTSNFEPARALTSGSNLVAFNDNFIGVSAQVTTTLTVKMQLDTGSAIITVNQSALNIVVFPCDLTANYTVSDITARIVTAAYSTLKKSNVDGIGIDGNGYLYASLKNNAAGPDNWSVYQSKNGGVTWSNLNLPGVTGIYSAGYTSLSNANIYAVGDNVHITHVAKNSASVTRYFQFAYNFYNVAISAWGTTSMVSVSNPYTYQNDYYMHGIEDPSSQVHLVAGPYSTYYKQFHNQSAWALSGIATWDGWVSATGTYGENAKVIRDLNTTADSSALFMLYGRTTTNGKYLQQYNGSDWLVSSSVLTLPGISAVSSDEVDMRMSDKSQDLWVLCNSTLSAINTIYLHRYTAQSTTPATTISFTIGATYDHKLIIADYGGTTEDPVIFYGTSTKLYYKRYKMSSSAWDTAVEVAKYNALDLYTGQPHPIYKNGAVYLTYLSGTAISSASTIFKKFTIAP